MTEAGSTARPAGPDAGGVPAAPDPAAGPGDPGAAGDRPASDPAAGHSDPGGRAGQLASSGLRPGWTTGACACAAATAAFTALTSGEFPDPVVIELPGGKRPAFALTQEALGDGSAMAAVTKDAGDDPDLTHLAVVRATVSAGQPGSGVTFRGGPGVGRVTLPGLPVDVGEPAINPGPRGYLRANLTAANGGAEPDVVVEVSIDNGAELATHTLNPRLGILGGLSVLGTTGVVVPYSCAAWIDSIKRGIDVARAAGLTHVAGCTGSTSERVATELLGLEGLALLDMGDFVGAVLKHLRRAPVDRLSLVGGFAKLTKLANGHLDLHSGRSTVDTAHLASLARSAGADDALVAAVEAAPNAGAALKASLAAGFPLGDVVCAAARDQALAVLGGAPVEVEVVAIDRAGGVVGRA